MRSSVRSAAQQCKGSSEIGARQTWKRTLPYRWKVKAKRSLSLCLAVQAEGFRAPTGSTLKQYVSKDGLWRIRPVRPDEVPTVAALQAEAFFQPVPLVPLNKLFLYGFQAEVLDAVRQKMKYSPHEGFACLIAEDASQPAEIVGVVEVSLQAGQSELATLKERGLEELVYAYVACMAVRPNNRRRGIASALLEAAEIQAGNWKQNWVLLHVYADNHQAASLYQCNGYVELSRDPGWRQLLGQRQRLLLAKGAAVTGAAGAIQSLTTSVMRIFQQQEAKAES